MVNCTLVHCVNVASPFFSPCVEARIKFTLAAVKSSERPRGLNDGKEATVAPKPRGKTARGSKDDHRTAERSGKAIALFTRVLRDECTIDRWPGEGHKADQGPEKADPVTDGAHVRDLGNTSGDNRNVDACDKAIHDAKGEDGRERVGGDPEGEEKSAGKNGRYDEDIESTNLVPDATQETANGRAGVDKRHRVSGDRRRAHAFGPRCRVEERGEKAQESEGSTKSQ